MQNTVVEVDVLPLDAEQVPIRKAGAPLLGSPRRVRRDQGTVLHG